MAFFSVTTTIPTIKGTAVFFPFQCECESLEELHDYISLHGSIIGWRYRLKHAPDGAKYLGEKRRVVLGQFATIIDFDEPDVIASR